MSEAEFLTALIGLLSRAPVSMIRRPLNLGQWRVEITDVAEIEQSVRAAAAGEVCQ